MPRQQRFSPRDEVYLASTSFEVYMAAGGVFIGLFGLLFLISIKIGFELLVWPALLVSVLAGYITLNRLEKRERKRKLAELEAEYAAKERRAVGD
ncbi:MULTISPECIES: hypothetical protein [Chloroflexus]|jgi:peptidoglycan/LPS O-acetylase OafA/YrhL|uniref:Uncharacterized protein n=1 Tax=Chloroflexus aggregans (strain MD-66 / DSM 9485) TaxID=326427 RepID=B8G7T5_CHLAD|nr:MULTISPECIES: hypothetical protein [Chloroflexus]ACL24114.1 conserved hypothetical protein [Chloroflexus aggregans DSM 9485]GIV90401.1 MAG: hypothetical protein KatS3mg055_2919 [Chloroflexus sp.]